MSEGPSKKKGTKLAKDNPTVPKFTLFSNSDQGKQKPLNKQTDGAKASEQTAPLAASNKPCARILKSQLDEMRPTGVAKSTTSAKLLEDVAAQVSQIAAGTKAWSDSMNSMASKMKKNPNAWMDAVMKAQGDGRGEKTGKNAPELESTAEMTAVSNVTDGTKTTQPQPLPCVMPVPGGASGTRKEKLPMTPVEQESLPMTLPRSLHTTPIQRVPPQLPSPGHMCVVCVCV